MGLLIYITIAHTIAFMRLHAHNPIVYVSTLLVNHAVASMMSFTYQMPKRPSPRRVRLWRRLLVDVTTRAMCEALLVISVIRFSHHMLSFVFLVGQMCVHCIRNNDDYRIIWVWWDLYGVCKTWIAYWNNTITYQFLIARFIAVQTAALSIPVIGLCAPGISTRTALRVSTVVIFIVEIFVGRCL